MKEHSNDMIEIHLNLYLQRRLIPLNRSRITLIKKTFLFSLDFCIYQTGRKWGKIIEHG